MTDDCEQSGPCAAKAPGCARHFMGLVAELRAEVEHWRGAAKEHAEAHAAAESEIERIQIEELKGRIERQTDWYQQRFNRLREWVKEEVEPLSKEVAHRYFSICANGTPAPHESADWTETMHELKLRAEQAEQNVKNLTAERDHFKAMLRERADSLLEARAAAEKQSLEFRAIAKAIDAAREACDREAESHPSSRSSAPLVRYVAAMDRLRKWLTEETEAVSAPGIESEREL